jgi:aspartate/methionine/tyrosine aminotransferase
MSEIQRKNSFMESVIHEMSRVALQHGDVNLAQGFPDFPCPEELKKAARNTSNSKRTVAEIVGITKN